METEGIEMSEMERGFPGRQLDDHDMREIEELATIVTEHVMRNEGEEGFELWKQHSIYKVPAHIAAVNPEAFTPKLVSMGPYHHGQDLLKPMEVHKRRAARVFIQKSKKPTKDFIKALWEVLPELMASYSHLDHVWMRENNRRRFLELMLIDGCFLLELLRVHSWNFDGYASHDPVFSRRGLAFDPYLILDQFMLENQVPFTAIEKLLTVQNGKTAEENCKYINNLMCMFAFWRQDPDVGRGLHMLDVVRKIMVEPKNVELRKEQIEEDEDKLLAMDKMRTATKFWSATELCEAGVKFKAVDDEAIALSSVDFENRVLTIPIIRPPLALEVLGCNIIAFEVIHHRSLFLALSYFTFMNGLLASAADVRYLRSLKIIQSTELSDDAIVQTYKKVVLGTPVIFPFSNLYGVQHQLNELYMDRMTGCSGRLWGWITSLKHNYLKSPWTFISVVAATLLLVFTMTQTYYAALPYWDSERKNN